MLTRHKRAGTSKFVHNHETTSTGILLFAALDWKSTRRFTDKLVTISKKHYSTTLLKNPTRDPNSKIQRPSIKPAIWNIPEHSGTSRNILKHRIIIIIMRKKCVKLNFGIAYGRTFHRGKSIETYMRLLIVNDILSGGGNVLTEHYPGSF